MRRNLTGRSMAKAGGRVARAGERRRAKTAAGVCGAAGRRAGGPALGPRGGGGGGGGGRRRRGGRGGGAEPAAVGDRVDVAVAHAEDVDRAGARTEVAQAVADGVGGDRARRAGRLGEGEAERQVGGQRGGV